MGVTVVVGTGERYVSGGDAAGAASCGRVALCCPSLGAVLEQAARVAGCWSMQSSVEPSRSQRKSLVGVTSHLVAGQARRLSWEKIPRSHPLTCGFRAGGGEG